MKEDKKKRDILNHLLDNNIFKRNREYYNTIPLPKKDDVKIKIDDFTKERDSFYEELIWDDPIKKKEKQKKEIDKNEKNGN